MNSIRRFALALMLLCAPLSARASDLLAVLDVDTPDRSVSVDELPVLSDAARKVVVAEVGKRFRVMTRETMVELVPPEKVACFVDKCLAEIGRMLQARYIMGGNVRRLGKSLVLTLELYESGSSQLVGSEQFIAPSTEALFLEVSEKLRPAFRRWLSSASTQGAGPVGTERRIDAAGGFEVTEEDEVVVMFETSPAGAVVTLDGRLLCQSSPCSKRVSAGRHDVVVAKEEYDDVVATLEVSEKSKRFTYDLPPAFATLSVETTPPGLVVTLDGRELQATPLSGVHLTPGSHSVLIKDRCQDATGETFVVAKGDRRALKLTATPRLAGLKVEARDRKGNDLEGEVWVDGALAGSAWKTLKLPLCARTAELRPPKGRVVSVPLALVEREVQRAEVTGGGVDEELVAMVANDLVGVNTSVPPEPLRRARYAKACTEGEAIGCSLAKAPRLPVLSWDGLDGATFAAACERGAMASCLAAARVLSTTGPGKRPSLSRTEFSKALDGARALCEAGSPAGCLEDGRFLDLGGLVATKKEPTKAPELYRRAVDLYRRACTGGEMNGCWELGLMHELGTGLPADAAAAVELYRKACDGGAMTGCRYLGMTYTFGTGVARSHVTASTVYRRACEGGDMVGCWFLGINYNKGDGVATDKFQAVNLYRKACDGGVMGGCRSLGIMYEHGSGVATDKGMAVNLYREACDGGDLEGCKFLGVMYSLGTGVTADKAKALELYRKACDGGEMSGCTSLGIAYNNGEGVSVDKSRGAELHRKACDGGMMISCRYLGTMYGTGSGVSADISMAVDLYRKACDGGDMGGCMGLGISYENGSGVTKDQSRADSLFKQACEGGDNSGCGAYGNALYKGLEGPSRRSEGVKLMRQSCAGGYDWVCKRLDDAGESR